MTAKKPSDTAKTAALKAAAELKADEVAAMMGDDVETSATQKPSAPPALKGSAKSEPEPEEQAEAAEQAESEGTVKTAIQDDVDAGEDESEDEPEDGEQEEVEQEEVEQAKVGHMVILHKTIHTKDADGKDVKYIASKDPQDLGEYGDMAIAAGCAKPHKAG
jgi:hypothetical protein